MNFFKPKFWDKNKVSFFSILLYPITILIKFLIFLKIILTKTHDSPIPIICIGNIYLGGTGKTPLCIEIFSILKNLNMNPAFVRKRLKRLKTLINKETGKSKTEEKEILFLSQNFGLKKFIYNYLYIFF